MNCYGCRARLCPLTPKRWQMRIKWYSDDPVCLKSAREVPCPRWVKVQRLIWCKRPKPWGWFTIPMLESLLIPVPEKVHGIAPSDRWYQIAEREWIQNYGQRSPIYCRRPKKKEENDEADQVSQG